MLGYAVPLVCSMRLVVRWHDWFCVWRLRGFVARWCLQPLVDGGNWLFSISDACEEVCGEDEEVRHNSKV